METINVLTVYVMHIWHMAFNHIDHDSLRQHDIEMEYDASSLSRL